MSDTVGYLLFVIFGIAFIFYMFWYDKNHAEKWQTERKKNGKLKKPLHKRWWTWVIVVVCIVGGLGNLLGLNDSDDDSDDEPETTEVAKPNKKSKAEKKAEAKKQSEEEKASNSANKEDKKIQAALSIIRESYKGKAKVWYSKKDDCFEIQPTQPEFTAALVEVINNDDKDEWKGLTDSIDTLSKAVAKDAHINAGVGVVNPQNKKKLLYESVDGISFYDFMDEK